MNLRSLSCVALASTLFFAAKAHAQMQISVGLHKENFLQYEAIPVQVTITNISDSPILLGAGESQDQGWLSFILYDSTGNKIRAVKRWIQPALTIQPQASETVEVNITPFYAVRDTGPYRIKAVVETPGSRPYLTSELVFSLGKGEPVWSDEKIEGGIRRRYSIIRFLGLDSSDLYFRVEEPSQNTIFCTVSLGRYTAFTKPVVQIDGKGDIHVVHTLSGHTYRYTHLTPTGQILAVENRQISGARPSLVLNSAGEVEFVGGIKAPTENQERPKLSDGQQGLM